MEIKIKGTPKEIAALVRKIQKRQGIKEKLNSPENLIRCISQCENQLTSETDP